MQKSDPGRIAKERERRRREKERKKNKEKFRRKHCSNTPFFFLYKTSKRSESP